MKQLLSVEVRKLADDNLGSSSSLVLIQGRLGMPGVCSAVTPETVETGFRAWTTDALWLVPGTASLRISHSASDTPEPPGTGVVKEVSIVNPAGKPTIGRRM